MKSSGEFQMIAKQIQTECRRKQPQIEKLCEQLLRKGTSINTDVVEQLLDLLSNTCNKKLMLLGSRMLQSAASMGLHIDEACILSYFDGMARAEDEDMQLKIVQCIPKQLNRWHLTAVFVQKFYAYCSKLKSQYGARVGVAEACGECLTKLFQKYFAQQQEDYKQVFFHLISELEPKGNDSRCSKMFKNRAIHILMNTEGLNRRDFLERLVEAFSASTYTTKSDMSTKEDQCYEKDIVAAIQIVGQRPQLRNLPRLLEKILVAFESHGDSPTNLIKTVQRNWFKDFNMLSTLYRCDREAMVWLVRIFGALEFRMLAISSRVVPIRSDRFVASVHELLLTMRRELFLYANVQQLLQANVLRPASEEFLEQLKLNFLNYFLHNIGPKLARLLGLVCKWSQYQGFKGAIEEIEGWVVLSGLFQFKSPTIDFMKALAYACLPRRDGCTLTDKNLKALQAMLELLHRKVYLMEVESLTLVLKVIQALQKYFLMDGSTVTREEVSNFTEIEEEVLHQYRVVREVFRNLFQTSQDLVPKLIETFLQALTQVAFDTLTKISHPRALEPNFGPNLKDGHESTFNEKIFALDKVCTIALRNIHRIEQFWTILSNFLLTHIAYRDFKISLQGVEVMYHILLEIARYECESQRQPDLRLVLNSVLETVKSCPQERVQLALIEGLSKLLQNHQDHVQRNLPLLMDILNIAASHTSRAVLHAIEKCLDICIKDFGEEKGIEHAARIVGILNMLVGKDSDTKKGSKLWKQVGCLLNRVCLTLQKNSEQGVVDKREVESDCELSHKPLYYSLRRSSSLKKNSGFTEGFADCLQSVMDVYIKSFVECSVNESEHYLQVLTWTLMRHLHLLPVTSITQVVVPSMNKLLMFLIDRSTAGIPDETPNFNTGRKNCQQNEQLHWQYNTTIFVTQVYQQIIQLVGCVLYSRKTTAKPATSIVKTLVFTLNTCLVKRSIKGLNQLISILYLGLQQLPEIIVNSESLLINTNKFLEFLDDESTPFSAEQLQLINELQLFICCLGELTKKESIKVQVQVLETVRLLLGVYKSHNIRAVLRQELILHISRSSQEAIRSFTDTNRTQKRDQKDPLSVELEKVQFRHKVHQRIRNTRSIQTSANNQSTVYQDDPEQLYSILLNVKPNMPDGLISFLQQTVGVVLSSIQQREEFVLRILPQLLSEERRKDPYCIEQVKYIRDLLTSTSHFAKQNGLQRRIVEAVSQLCKVHQRIELFELLAQLCQKGLAATICLEQKGRNEKSLEEAKKIVDVLGDTSVGPEFNSALTHSNSHITRSYELLLECLRLNDRELTENTVAVLKRLTPLIMKQ